MEKTHILKELFTLVSFFLRSLSVIMRLILKQKTSRKSYSELAGDSAG